MARVRNMQEQEASEEKDGEMYGVEAEPGG